MDPGLHATTESVTGVLAGRGLRVASAESCTGGRIAAALTTLPGSSSWFDCGCVVYSNAAKTRLLGVDESGLAVQGAVSRWTVEAMCGGLLERSSADLVVATSGIAGPHGGTAEKPVGTVCLAWQRRDLEPRSMRVVYPGDREQVITRTVLAALEGLLTEANQNPADHPERNPG